METELNGLVDHLYDELRVIARSRLRSVRRGQTLHTTALVHEAYMKLADQHSVEWSSRSQFLGLAALAMRRIVMDHLRKRSAVKRGGDEPHISLSDPFFDTGELATEDPVIKALESSSGLLALDAALTKLEQENPQLNKIVVYRFFGGMSIREVAEALDISPATVKRHWAFARVWLYRDLKDRLNA